jgi:hypothetical protein
MVRQDSRTVEQVVLFRIKDDRPNAAPAELWPPARQLASSAIIGHVTLADVEGRSGAWRWMLASPHQLAEPATGVHGHPGLWPIDLPPRLSTSENTPRVDLAVPSPARPDL